MGFSVGGAVVLGLVCLSTLGCGELIDGRVSIELAAGCRPSLAEIQQTVDMYCLSLESPNGLLQAGPNCSTSLAGADLKVDERAGPVVIVVEGFEELPNGRHQVVVRGKSAPLPLVSGRDDSVLVPLAPVGQFGVQAADWANCQGLPFALQGHTASVYPSGLVLLVGSRRPDVPAGQAALLVDSHANTVVPLATPVSLRRGGHVAEIGRAHV
jgi:hypothetical protein